MAERQPRERREEAQQIPTTGRHRHGNLSRHIAGAGAGTVPGAVTVPRRRGVRLSPLCGTDRGGRRQNAKRGERVGEIPASTTQDVDVDVDVDVAVTVAVTTARVAVPVVVATFVAVAVTLVWSGERRGGNKRGCLFWGGSLLFDQTSEDLTRE